MSNSFESNAAGDTNLSFEGHCAKTNADEANEIQEHAITAKKWKKRGIEAITDEEAAQRNRERIPANTRKATSWAVSVWDDWAKREEFTAPRQKGERWFRSGTGGESIIYNMRLRALILVEQICLWNQKEGWHLLSSQHLIANLCWSTAVFERKWKSRYGDVSRLAIKVISRFTGLSNEMFDARRS